MCSNVGFAVVLFQLVKHICCRFSFVNFYRKKTHTIYRRFEYQILDSNIHFKITKHEIFILPTDTKNFMFEYFFQVQNKL